SEAAVEAAQPTETSADELAEGEIEHYEMSEPELALAEAMEEYAISPEAQARMDEQLRAEQEGEAQEERSKAAQEDAAPESVGEAIDENTQLSQTGNDAEAIEYG